MCGSAVKTVIIMTFFGKKSAFLISTAVNSMSIFKIIGSYFRVQLHVINFIVIIYFTKIVRQRCGVSRNEDQI